MEHTAQLLNSFLVSNFNRILRWEERVLSSAFEGILTVSEYHVIEAVIQAAALQENTMGEVAARLGVTVGTLTTAVKTLERKGFLMRQRGQADKRVVWLASTPIAQEANRFHEQFHHRMVGGIMDVLDRQQLASLTAALAVLDDWFAALEAESNYIAIEEEPEATGDDT